MNEQQILDLETKLEKQFKEFREELNKLKQDKIIFKRGFSYSDSKGNVYLIIYINKNIEDKFPLKALSLKDNMMCKYSLDGTFSLNGTFYGKNSYDLDYSTEQPYDSSLFEFIPGQTYSFKAP